MLKIFKLYNFLSKRQKLYFALIFFGIFLSTILEMISLAAIIPIFKLIFSETNLDVFILKDLKPVTILILFIILYLLKNIFLIFFNYFYINFFFNLCLGFSKKIFFNSLNAGYSFFLGKSSENFLRKVNNDASNARIYIISCMTLIIETIFVVCLAILLLLVDYKIFIFVILFFFTITYFYFFLFKNKLKKWSLSYQKNIGDVQFLVNQTVEGIKDIIIYNLQNFFHSKFSSFSNNLFNSQFKQEFLNQIQRFWMELICVLIFSFALIFLIINNQNLQDYLPLLILYGAAIFKLIPSFNKIILNKQSYKFYYPSFSEVIKLLNVGFKEKQVEITEKDFIFQKFIKIKNIKFKFNNSNKLLFDDLNLLINKNTSTLITGKNGTGKSTLLNIISGLLDASEGNIIIDDKINIKNNKFFWMNKISFVHQNIFILKASLKENIILDKEEDNIKLNSILDLIGFNQMFNDLDDLLRNETILLNTNKLSGGQKQIISIARALYRDSEILIFDEPDSALDDEKADKLKQILVSLKGTKTILMISHNIEINHPKIFDRHIILNQRGELTTNV